MLPAAVAAETSWHGRESYVESSNVRNPSMIALTAATICLIWYVAVVVVCATGYIQLYVQKHYNPTAYP